MTLELSLAFSLLTSAVSGGVVWGRLSQRVNTAEEKVSHLEAQVEMMKRSNGDTSLAIARLEGKVDQLYSALQAIREFLVRKADMIP